VALDDIDITCVSCPASGFTVVSARLPPGAGEPVPGGAARHVRRDGVAQREQRAFGGDGRVAAGGQSSGSSLVAACLMARDQGPSWSEQVLCYPWLDLGFDSSRIGSSTVPSPRR
jgi:acetyl esterase